MALHNVTMIEKTTLQTEITNTPRESSIKDAWSSNNWYTIAVVGTGLLIFLALSAIRRHQKNIIIKKKEEEYLHYFHTILPHSTIYGKIEHKPSLMEMMQKGLNGLTNIYTDLYMLQQLHGRPSAPDISEQTPAAAVASRQANTTDTSIQQGCSEGKSKFGKAFNKDVTIEMERTSAEVNGLAAKPKFYLGNVAERTKDISEEEDETRAAQGTEESDPLLKAMCKVNQKRYEQLFTSTKTADPDTEEGRKTIKQNARQFLKLNLAMISESDNTDAEENRKQTKRFAKQSSMPLLNGATRNVLVTEL